MKDLKMENLMLPKNGVIILEKELALKISGNGDICVCWPKRSQVPRHRLENHWEERVEKKPGQVCKAIESTLF